MSVVRKEDMPKVFKLVGAIVAVFGCAAWRVAGAVSSQAPKPPESAPAEEAAKVEVPATTAPEKPKDGEIELPTLFAASTINPFRFIDPPKSSLSAILPPPAGGNVSPLPMPVGGGMIQPLPTPGAESAPLRVTGIVSGPNATAVIETDGTAHVVRQGQRLPDGAVVERIGTTEVFLRRRGKTVVLDVAD